MHAWFASVPSLCKTIWLMAVAQHQFYLDRKQSKANMLKFKSLTDLANELNTSNLLITNPNLCDNMVVTHNDGFTLSRANSCKLKKLFFFDEIYSIHHELFLKYHLKSYWNNHVLPNKKCGSCIKHVKKILRNY